jgi:transcription initiation factor IIE alpha subunit
MIGYLLEQTEEDTVLHCPRCGLAFGLRQAMRAAFELYKATLGK